MKKVVVAFGGTRFSKGVFELASQLNALEPVLLVGVFLPDVVYADIYSFGSGMPATYFPPLLSPEEATSLQKNIDRFAHLCQHNNIAYRVHKNTDRMPLPALQQETRFADFLIISSEKFYNNLGLHEASPSLDETLHAAECPILVVPEAMRLPVCNVLAYDGSEASVFAIKQFAYLFPRLCENETLLVYVADANTNRFPDEIKMEELMTQHFKDLSLLKLTLHPKDDFTTWLHHRNDALLVGGSFSRSPVSRFFRKSFVADVIAERKLPVFIAHC